MRPPEEVGRRAAPAGGGSRAGCTVLLTRAADRRRPCVRVRGRDCGPRPRCAEDRERGVLAGGDASTTVVGPCADVAGEEHARVASRGRGRRAVPMATITASMSARVCSVPATSATLRRVERLARPAARPCASRRPRDRAALGEDRAHARAARTWTPACQQPARSLGVSGISVELLEREHLDVGRAAADRGHGAVAADRAAADHRDAPAGDAGWRPGSREVARSGDASSSPGMPSRIGSCQPGGDHARRRSPAPSSAPGRPPRRRSCTRDVAERRHERDVGVEHLGVEAVRPGSGRPCRPRRGRLEDVHRVAELREHRARRRARAGPPPTTATRRPVAGVTCDERGHHAERLGPRDDRRLHRRDLDGAVEELARAGRLAVASRGRPRRTRRRAGSSS